MGSQLTLEKVMISKLVYYEKVIIMTSKFQDRTAPHDSRVDGIGPSNGRSNIISSQNKIRIRSNKRGGPLGMAVSRFKRKAERDEEEEKG